MPRQEILVSNDILGIRGQAKLLPLVYARAAHALREINQPVKAEVLAWRHNVTEFLRVLHQAGFTPLGIHGSAGPTTPDQPAWERLKTVTFQRLITSTPELVRSPLLPNPGYLLVHETELRLPKSKQAILRTPPPIPLMLENVLYAGSLASTIDQAEELCQRGVNAGVMIDLLHLCKELNSQVRDLPVAALASLWERVLKRADEALSRVEVAGLHIPIGDNFDSLPVEKMDQSFWLALADLIDRHQETLRYLTLENQHHGGQIRLNPKHVPELDKRNGLLVDSLIQSGVLR